MYKISVIVPIYKSEQYVERCIKSLMEQSLDSIQYIFVNDCTPDRSLEIVSKVIDKYPQKEKDILIISNKINLGPSATRNTGIIHAQGEFVAFCDSDDWIDSTMYEILYKKCLNENADIAFCDLNLVKKNGSKTSFCCYASHYEDKKSFIRSFISSKWTPLMNCIIKKELIDNYNISLPLDITYCEDFHFMIRALYYASKVTKVNACLYNYFEDNAESIMHNLNKYSGIDDLNCYLQTIEFFTREGCITFFEQEMSWRVLNAFHLDMYIPQKHAQICSIYPICHKYILSNPFYNRRQKQLMWLLTHKCRWVVLCFLGLKRLLGRENIV